MSESIKIRGETLGSFLKDRAVTSTTVNESDAGAAAYNPGFPASDHKRLGDHDVGIPTRADELKPDTGTQDLSVAALRALNDYAASLAENSIEPPPELPIAGYVPNRGESIRPGEGFIDRTPGVDKKVGDEWDAAKDNFETLSGGVSADATLGSFFGADRLEGAAEDPEAVALISKTGFPGSPSANDLLKNRANEIGSLVEEVLDKTNRFSPKPGSSPYLKTPPGGDTAAGGTPESAGDAYSKGLWSVQTGRDNKTGLGSGFDPNAPYMNLGALRAMASRMMLEASGEYLIDDLIGVDDGPTAQFLSILAVTNLVGINPANIFQVGFADLYEEVRIINIAKEESGSFDAHIPWTDFGKDDANIKEAMKRLAQSTGADTFLEGASRSGYTQNSLSDFVADTPNANLNSWAEPFAGTNPIGMFSACIVSLILMSIMVSMIDYFVDTAKRDPGMTPYDPYRPANLAMGMHRPRDDKTDDMLFAYLKLNGFPELRSTSDFATAVVRGMKRFYGFDIDLRNMGNPVEQVKLLTNAVNMALSPGYYVTMNRQILRDVRAVLGRMADAFMSDVGNALGGLLLGGDALKAVGIFKAFEALSASTIFNFLKICVSLGDIAYDALYSPGRPSTGGMVIPYGSEPMVKVLSAQDRLGLSRFYGGTSKDTKGIPRSPLSLHLQNTLLLASQRLPQVPGLRHGGPIKERDAQKKPRSENGTIVSTVIPQAPGRFDAETVRSYEMVLDQEYTPFYMHDLRTNELIAFPAFISSVSDSFSPEYTETQGYGRTDAVRTYNKTTRTIDITFVLAAMNATDMNYMWFAINKLVAMCYPQRSVGKIRTYNAGKGRFIQPFSQVPTASPVIRLRLGELFHSNYSIEGLKRMFGVGTPGFDTDVLDPQDTEFWKKQQTLNVPDAKLTSLAKQRILDAFLDADKGVANPEASYWLGAGATLVLNSIPEPPSGGGLLGALGAAAGLLPGGADAATFVGVSLQSGCEFKLLDPTPVKAKPPVDKSKRKETPYAPRDDSPTEMFYKIEAIFVSDDHARHAFRNNSKLEELRGDLLKIPALLQVSSIDEMSVTSNGELERMKEEVLKELSAAAMPTSQKRKDDEDEFFDSSNAIVRSFRSTAGRGLAGVINSLSMNYDGANWGTDWSAKNRVPQKVEITMGFSPIHDLPLGLDSEGELVAPAYPVGSLNTDPFAVMPASMEDRLIAEQRESAEKTPYPTPKLKATIQSENQKKEKGDAGISMKLPF